MRTTTERRSAAGLLIGRMGAYTVIQLVGFLAPLIALPVVARSTSTAGWVSLGLGQAVGVMASVVILFGWWTIGQVEYVRQPDTAARHALYRRSLFERFLVSIIVLPASVVVAVAIAPSGYRLLAGVSVLGMASLGYSPRWYFIAMQSPKKLFIYDALPRVVAALMSTLLVALTGQVMFYPVLLAVLPMGAYALALRRESPRTSVKVVDWPIIISDFRRQVPIASSSILGGLYSQLMTPYVAIVAPGAVSVFISGDRLYKAGRFVTTAAGNTFQPWTLERPSFQRHVAAVGAHATLGVVGCIVSWLLLPPVSAVMFGDQLRVPSNLAAGFGVGFLCNSIATPLIRNILIPSGRRAVPLLGTIVATVTAFGLLAVLPGSMSLNTVALAIGASEAGCLVVVGAAAMPILVGAHKSSKMVGS